MLTVRFVGLQKRSYYCWYTVVHAVWGKLSCVVMWSKRFRITVCRRYDDARRYLAEHDDALIIYARIYNGQPLMQTARRCAQPPPTHRRGGGIATRATPDGQGTGDYPGSRRL